MFNYASNFLFKIYEIKKIEKIDKVILNIFFHGLLYEDCPSVSTSSNVATISNFLSQLFQPGSSILCQGVRHVIRDYCSLVILKSSAIDCYLEPHVQNQNVFQVLTFCFI